MAATKRKTHAKRANAEPEAKKGALALAPIAPEVLLFKEAAQFLNTSTHVVRQEVRRGRLKALRVGNRKLGFRIQALRDYLLQREQEGIAL